MEQEKKFAGKAVKDFKDLHIYQIGRELARAIYDLTKKPPLARDYSLVDQMRRASVWVLSNIAEGFERDNNKEFITFLYIAKASCGELRAQLDIALDQAYIDSKSAKELSDRCKQLGAMMNRLILYLKRSQLAGLRHKSSS